MRPLSTLVFSVVVVGLVLVEHVLVGIAIVAAIAAIVLLVLGVIWARGLSTSYRDLMERVDALETAVHKR